MLYESQQPTHIDYGSFDPYVISVVQGPIQWNTLGWPRSIILRVTRKGDTSYGHFIEIDLHVDDDEETVAVWTEEGIDVTFSLGHKLTIPKRAFVGGR